MYLAQIKLLLLRSFRRINSFRLFCTINQEIWKTCVVQGYLNCPNYEVSNFSRVRTKTEGKILEYTRKSKRLSIWIRNNDGQREMWRDYRLSCLVHNGIPNKNETEVDHIDGNAENNQISNSQWIDQSSHKKKTWDSPKDKTNRGMPLLKLDKNRKTVGEFKSYAYATRIEGVSVHQLRYSIKHQKELNGFFWKTQTNINLENEE